ncbi:MAG: S9 family peptidase [Candidatus Eisenbacteria bacterium]|nr:S9 family peptidase [Candidatus Eisenbacteria bacterium]
MATRTTRSRKKPITFADMMAVGRVSQPAVSPDGLRLAFTVSRPDPKENRTRQSIHLLDLETREVRELTPGPGNHGQPAWSPDGLRLAFVSDRDKEKGRQLWVMPADGGEARCVTSGYGGASQPVWAPDSRRVAFARRVVVSPDWKPGKGEKIDPAEGPSRARVFGLKNEKSSARVADELLFRHWDTWRDRRRNHVVVIDTVTGKMTDLTPVDADAPPISLGSERDIDWSPDGNEIAYVMNPDPVPARSTNNCVFAQTVKGIRAVGKARLLSDSKACDCHPRYAADGSLLLYLGMSVPGYEADKFRIKAYDRKSGETRVWLDRFDRSPDGFETIPGGGLLFQAQDRGRITLYRLDLSSGRIRQLTFGTYNGSFRTVPGRSAVIVTRETTATPADFWLLTPGAGIKPHLAPGPAPEEIPEDAGATAERLTRFGDALARVEMNEAEEFWYAGDGGTPIHGFLIRPPHPKPGKKVPLVLLIHGGPQGAFMDHFHYRWNSQMFAARGAAVAFLNPRGSTGYGKKLTDQISGDWGGRCYKDILLGVDHLLAAHSFLDRKRVAAAGASFGGFMVNWILGRTDRFRALVCHDGIFHAETMAYSTEELWFEEHEHGGMPHENRRGFLKYSPHLHVKNYKTPTLVVHGEQDFRCPLSEGLSLFTALQVMGVPSRFLCFPDEGHWVQQPANAEVWYEEVVGWLMKHLG